MKTVSYSAKCKASPSKASEKILSKEGLKAWWLNKIISIEQDINWPAVNSKMKWKMKGGTFAATILEDKRPSEVVMEVITPSANSRITHSFEALPEGGTLYTKTVIPVPRSWFMGVLMIPFSPMLKSFVKKEVMRAAEYADKG